MRCPVCGDKNCPYTFSSFSQRYYNARAMLNEEVTPSGLPTYAMRDEFAYLSQQRAQDIEYQRRLNYTPWNMPEEVEMIQGNPKGARYLISYAFKEDKDPVVFLKSKKDMMVMLEKIMKDEKVDQKTVLVSQITNQFKPKVVSKRVKIFQTVESIELEKQE